MTSTEIRPGAKLRCPACGTAVIVIRGAGTADLACGGQALHHSEGDASGPSTPHAVTAGAELGKRYVDEAGTIEVLCTTAGVGELTLDGVPLSLKQAKLLPASD